MYARELRGNIGKSPLAWGGGVHVISTIEVFVFN